MPDPVIAEFTLDTDSSDVWYVRRAVLHERLGDIYLLEIDVVHPARTAPELATVLGASCCLTLTHGETDRCVRGLVRQVVDRGTPGKKGREYKHAHLEVVPALWVLSQCMTSRIFPPKLSLIEHVAEVIGERVTQFNRKKPDVKAGTQKKRLKDLDNYPKRDFVLQYRETDLDLVRRLLQEEGISFHFDHSDAAAKEQVIFTDHNEGFLVDSDNDPGPDIHLEEGEGLVISVSTAERVASNKVMTFDRCWTDNTPVKDEVAGEMLQGIELPINESETSTEFADGDSKKNQAKIRLDIEGSEARLAYAETRIISVMPGQVCHVLTAELDGKFLLTQVTARYNSGENYGLVADDVSEEEEYSNEIRCMRVDNTEVQFRPKRNVPRPKISGLVPATVIQLEGGNEDVNTPDERHGRVALNLHFDKGQSQTAWVRVAQPWAGNGYGVWFLPRVGMEVAVVFEQGDPDRPLVIGCLYGAPKAPRSEISPPFVMPAQKSRSGLITTSTYGFKGHNMLWFEDGKPKTGEHFHLQAQKDMNVVIHNSEVITVGDASASEDSPGAEHPARKAKHCRTIFVGEAAMKELLCHDPHHAKTNLFADLKMHRHLPRHYDAGGAKAPFPPLDVEGSELKIIMGNLNEEIEGNASIVVGTTSVLKT